MTAPSVIVLGGPNGSGKSTAAVRLLRDELQVREFVNADQIAQGISAFRAEAHAVEAGRVMLTQLRKLVAARESFAFESTLASRTFGPWIREIRGELGYRFRLIFFCLENVELNVQRVTDRVALGGHNVPEEIVRRRFSRSMKNLFDLYLPLADRWEVYDNTEFDEPRLIACGTTGEISQIADADLWTNLKGDYDT